MSKRRNSVKIFVNEIERDVPLGATVAEVAQRFKPGADVLIRNGFPAVPDAIVTSGDQIALIKRGEKPTADELEALMCSRHTPGVHAAAKRARVGIAGLGGLGSHVAMALARVGVGHLVLVDFDVVEPSNLNRQLYFVDQIGMTKAEALTKNLEAASPCVELVSHVERITPDNVTELFGGCDIVVEAFDVAAQKAMLVEAVLGQLPDATMVAASGLAGTGPGEEIKVHRIGPKFIVVGDLTTEARPGMGLMAPRVGIAAHMQANVVLRLILGEEV